MAGAAAAEAVFHRNPSGIDAAAASRGGLGCYDQRRGWQSLPHAPAFEVCVGLSGKTHDTGAMVAGVGRLCADTPVARRLIETLGDLARAGQVRSSPASSPPWPPSSTWRMAFLPGWASPRPSSMTWSTWRARPVPRVPS